MIDWPRPEIISALALAVSVLSLAATLFIAWRTAAAEKPLAWIKLEPTGNEECWVANIHLRNRSRFDLRGREVWVPIKSVPITKKQDFFMIEYSNGFTTAPSGKRVLIDDFDHVERAFKIIFGDNAPVKPGATQVLPVLLIRSRFSDELIVRMSFRFEIMKPQPRYSVINLIGRIPTGALRIVI